jgi:PKD repeat protein
MNCLTSLSKIGSSLLLTTLLIGLGSRAECGVNEWTIIGPFGGGSVALAVAGPDLMYAGTYDGTVFKSSSSGSRWDPTGFMGFEDKFQLGTLKVSPTGSLYGGSSEWGLYRSIDGGQTWKSLKSRPGIPYRAKDSKEAKSVEMRAGVLDLVIDGAGSVYVSTLFGDTQYNIFKSIDEGNTFTEVFSSNVFIVLALDIWGRVYAATGNGLYRTTNGGLNWSFIGPQNIEQIKAIGADNYGRVMISTSNAFYKSIDDGNHWSRISESQSLEDVSKIIADAAGTFYAVNSQGFWRYYESSDRWTRSNTGLASTYINDLAVDHYHGSIYAATSEGVCKTSNGGSLWEPVNNGFSAIYVSSMAVDSEGGIYAPRWGYGLYRSINDGQSWEWANNGLPKGYEDQKYYIDGLAADNSGTLYGFKNAWAYNSILKQWIYKFEPGIYKSQNRGASWFPINFSSTTYLLIDFNNSNTLFSGLFNWYKGDTECVLKSLDQGNTWKMLNLLSSQDYNASVKSIAIDKLGSIYASVYAFDDNNTNNSMYSPVNGLYKSNDGGMTWFKLFPPDFVEYYPNENPHHSFFFTLAADPRAERTIYGGHWSKGVYRSDDGGSSWSNIGLGKQGIWSILVSPVSGAVYAATKTGGVFKGEAQGDNYTWRQISKGPSLKDFRSLAFDPRDPTKTTLLAGTTTGVHRIQDVEPPLASFTLTPLLPGATQTVTFQSTSTGHATEYLWNFGDNTAGSGPVVTHQYAAPGSYAVILTARGAAGESTSSPVIVKVGRKPNTKLQVILKGPDSGRQNVDLHFQAIVNNPAGCPLYYEFDWGVRNKKQKVGYFPSATPLQTYRWTAPGRYRVRARAVPTGGPSLRPSAWSRPLTVTISNGAPVLNGPDDVNPDKDTTCVYTATPVSPDDVEFSFRFGERGEWKDFSRLSSYVYSWSDPGVYCVQVRARNKKDEITNESPCLYVNVQDPNIIGNQGS